MGEKFEYGSPGPKKVQIEGTNGRIEVAEPVARVIEAQRKAQPTEKQSEKKGA